MVKRLTECNFVVHHPLAIPTIFCDIERNRHFALSEPVIDKLVKKALKISKRQRRSSTSSRSTRRESLNSSQSAELMGDTEDLMKLWLQVSDLKRGLETWKQQLEQLILHCEDLDRAAPRRPDGSSDHLDALQYLDSGKRIRQRLVELRCEYDEKIRQCAQIIDGMVLAAQLVCIQTSSLALPCIKICELYPANDEDSPGVEQHRTGRHMDQHRHRQSYPGRFSTNAVHIVSHDGFLAGYLRRGEHDQILHPHT